MSFWKNAMRSTVAALGVAQGGVLDYSKCESFSEFQSEVKSNQHKKIYNTAAHVELHRGLSSQLDALRKNSYMETNGPHSRLIQGPKGIGKSTMLRTFFNQEHDNVVSLYLSYDELLRTKSQLKTHSVLELVHQALEEKTGINSNDFKSKNMGEQLIKALEANDKFFFLVVDEIDQLYRESPQNKSVYEIARSNLGDLAWLGNQTSGRFAVFLCGSSASCPLLVTCNADKEEFPLQIGAPNLNGQRYRTLRLSVALINNLKEMTGLLKEMGYEASEDVARLMLFQVGLVPRAVHQHIKSLQAGETLTFQNCCSHSHESGLKASSGLQGLLYKSLIEAFRTKNDKAIRLLTDEKTGRLCQWKVEQEKWESEIVPLNYEDIVACWTRVCYGDYASQSKNLHLLQQLIFGFCDQGKFSFESIDRSLPRALYPVYGAQIFLDHIEISLAQEFYHTVDLQLKEVFKRWAVKIEDKVIDKI